MDKKIIIFVLACLTFLFGSGFEEFGLVTKLEGNVVISRNNETITPLLSSRVYFNDYIFVSNNALVQIKTNYHSQLAIEPQTKIKIAGPDRFETSYGNYKLSPLYDNIPKHKNLTQALTYTAIFPGSGHFYINNTPKGISFSLATLFLLSNILTINPQSSITYHDILANKKEQYQQIYLAYWLLSLFDVTSETNAYNKKVSAEEAEIAGEK